MAGVVKGEEGVVAEAVGSEELRAAVVEWS